MTLLSRADYRVLAKDTVSADSDADAAIVNAQAQIEEILGRTGTLEHGTVTETLSLWPDGMVYPRAVPVDSATTGYVTSRQVYLSDPTYVDPVGGGVDILTRSWPGQENDGRAYSTRAVAPLVSITYVGGYTAGNVPFGLKRAIALLAKSYVDPNPGDDLLVNAPAGTKSLTVGDTSITLAYPTGTLTVPSIVANLLRPYLAADQRMTPT